MNKLDGKYRTTVVPEFFARFMEASFPGLDATTYSKAEQIRDAFLNKDTKDQLQIYITLSGKCYLFVNNKPISSPKDFQEA